MPQEVLKSTTSSESFRGLLFPSEPMFNGDKLKTQIENSLNETPNTCTDKLYLPEFRICFYSTKEGENGKTEALLCELINATSVGVQNHVSLVFQIVPILLMLAGTFEFLL
ncbi:hypothetical protein PoB_002754800 [Plakobranchus ocellatus]|uniref:Uncharacterized protein n=1 Tax=Plakobranchus ocellatus TaxID=259542 RepID=A0AAV4A1M0_9GAST|nr:hypothetical protein PoB_002754800 [Plakobranchus ocellatus]